MSPRARDGSRRGEENRAYAPPPLAEPALSRTHAVISREYKCLRTGQFCVRRYAAQYRKYGYRCVKYDSRVDRYRPTRA